MSMTRNPTRRTVLTNAGCLALAAPFLSLLGCDETPMGVSTVGFSGSTMGTRYRVTISGDGRGTDADHLQAGVEDVLETVNRQMSTYRPDSELSRFNAAVETSWVDTSSAVTHVASRALEISRSTGGAFDPTIAPLVDLWGFGPGAQTASLPDAARIRATLQRTGYAGVDTASGAIRKARPDLHLDLSGIGKGFAVDQVAEYLESAGAEHFLVDIGGDMRARRTSADRAAWRIGIEKPATGRRTVHRIIALGDGAVATSGDYRNFFQSGGARYSHIIDPRTGKPVDHDLASVTVIAPTAEEADAWSTALMVLGPGAGPQLAERSGIAAYFITRTEDGLADRPAGGFERYLIG